MTSSPWIQFEVINYTHVLARILKLIIGRTEIYCICVIVDFFFNVFPHWTQFCYPRVKKKKKSFINNFQL